MKRWDNIQNGGEREQRTKPLGGGGRQQKVESAHGSINVRERERKM